LKAFQLPDGAIAGTPTPDQRCDVPAHPNSVIEVAAGGIPATIHHEYLGLVTTFALLVGVFTLPSGDIAAYGAGAVAIN
jgi:hypothetical protein